MSAGNLPDPGKAQDFVKKLAQVLDDDERIRDQLETLVSPTCSCKQAEVCVVSTDVSVWDHSVVPCNLNAVIPPLTLFVWSVIHTFKVLEAWTLSESLMVSVSNGHIVLKH